MDESNHSAFTKPNEELLRAGENRRREVEDALRRSENRLQSLLENIPDFVLLVDRNGIIQFANRGAPGVDRESLLGACVFDFTAAEHQETSRRTLDQAFATGLPQACQSQDILGQWWSNRLAPLAPEGGVDRALVISTDITTERLAAEAVKKEQRLLRQLLELHERQRKLTAYEIHDGFAQQLTGALFRLQAFRENLARDPAEAWRDFDSAAELLGRAIDETRRLITGLRPPILDEAGIIEAIEYLVCEHRQRGAPEIEFEHDVSFARLAPPLESAVFRIVQESLQNACRHSRSQRVRVTLAQRDRRIFIDVRDWGVGFDPDAVAEQRFGLQGIRERVRLLEGNVTIQSAPADGTLISVELPVVEAPNEPSAGPETWD
jgi:PAS domain S-box-containing protein